MKSSSCLTSLLGEILMALFVSLADAEAPAPFEARLVREDTGEAVADASVSIAGAAGSVRTDAGGRFTWSPAPTPPFQIIVVLSSGVVLQPIVVDSLEEGTMTIRIRTIAEESVTVIGAAPSIDTTPAAAATVLSATQIDRRAPESLTQALETLPGVGSVSEGHAAVPAVRGLARGRTLILLDGARVSAERRVGPGGSFLDPAILEGIDVARGPGSVAYGSDALGGVISLRTRRAEPGSPWGARLSGTVGAGVPEARGSLEVSKGLPRGGVLFQAHVRDAEDYDSPEGQIFNSGWEDQGFLLHVTHALGRGFLSTVWQSDFARDVERPRDDSRTVRFYYPYEDSHRFATTYEMTDVAGFRQMAFTGFLGSDDLRTDQDRFATGTTGRSIERADVSAKDFHVKGSAQRLVGAARLVFGADVNGRFDLEALDVAQTYDLNGDLAAETANVSIDDARRFDKGLFVQAESAPSARTRVAGGLRGDIVTTRNSGGFFGDRATSNSAVSGFAALTAGPFAGVSVTGQVSRGFRDPVLSDRYFRGPSGRGFITGNPGLDPESSLQLDLATRWSIGRTQAALYLYEYRIADLIERYEGQPDLFFFRNRGRALLRGAEVEARSDLGEGWSVEVSGHLSRGRALDDGADLDDVPAPMLAVLGRKEFEEGAYAQGRLAWYPKDDRPGPSEIDAPGATLLDLAGGWKLTRRLELRVVARNLLNDTYYASPDPRFVLAPGRSASLTAVARF